MISQTQRIALECYKEVKGFKDEEIDGKIEKKEVTVALRFDLVIPDRSPYAVVYEAIEDMRLEVKKMEEAGKRAIETEAAKEETEK